MGVSIYTLGSSTLQSSERWNEALAQKDMCNLQDGFDETLPIMEDVQLCITMHEAGPAALNQPPLTPVTHNCGGAGEPCSRSRFSGSNAGGGSGSCASTRLESRRRSRWVRGRIRLVWWPPAFTSGRRLEVLGNFQVSCLCAAIDKIPSPPVARAAAACRLQCSRTAQGRHVQVPHCTACRRREFTSQSASAGILEFHGSDSSGCIATCTQTSIVNVLLLPAAKPVALHA